MNSFGRIFKVSIFGESHGESVGIVIDGVINVAGGSQPVLSDNELVYNGNIPPYVALYYIMKVYPLAYAGVN